MGQTIAAEINRQSIPRICLDLEESDAIPRLDRLEAGFDVPAGGAEWTDELQIDGDMEVDTPHAIGRVIECASEILEEVHLGCPIKHASLVKKTRFIEVPQRSKRAFGSIARERTRYLHLADSDSSASIVRKDIRL